MLNRFVFQDRTALIQYVRDTESGAQKRAANLSPASFPPVVPLNGRGERPRPVSIRFDPGGVRAAHDLTADKDKSLTTFYRLDEASGAEV